LNRHLIENEDARLIIGELKFHCGLGKNCIVRSQETNFKRIWDIGDIVKLIEAAEMAKNEVVAA